MNLENIGVVLPYENRPYRLDVHFQKEGEFRSSDTALIQGSQESYLVIAETRIAWSTRFRFLARLLFVYDLLRHAKEYVIYREHMTRRTPAHWLCFAGLVSSYKWLIALCATSVVDAPVKRHSSMPADKCPV